MEELEFMMQSGDHVFGGNIYMTNGSHGCVNAPYYLANTIFDNIEEGSPVICYYE